MQRSLWIHIPSGVRSASQGLPGRGTHGDPGAALTTRVLCLAARPPRWSLGNEWALAAGRHASASPGLA